MHPLALEDVLHNRSQARSKADYYVKHLFVRVLRHTLGPKETEDPDEAKENKYAGFPRSQSPVDLIPEEDGSEDEKAGTKLFGHSSGTFSSMRGAMSQSTPDLERAKDIVPPVAPSPKRVVTSNSFRMVILFALLALTRALKFLQRRKQYAERLSIDELKKGARVNVQVVPFYIFLFRDGKAS